MDWVRTCFSDVGIDFPVVKEPSDIQALKRHGITPTTGFYLANSLAGDEVGSKVSLQSAEAGDIIFFGGTYGGYPADVITHVGLMIDKMIMIHRPTREGTVKQIHLGDYRYPVVDIRRPLFKVSEPTRPAPKVFLYFNANGFRLKLTEPLEAGFHDVEFVNAEFVLKS